MEYISHTKARKSKFMKRSKALKQKIHDLVTLCDIDAAMICYGVDGEVQTWPPQQEKLHQILKRYKDIPKEIRNMNMLVLDFEKISIAAPNPTPTATAAVVAAAEDNVKKSDNLSQFSSERLLKMERLLRKKQEEIQKRIDIIKNQTIEVSSGDDDVSSSTDGDEVEVSSDDDSSMDEEQVDNNDNEVDQPPKQADAPVGNLWSYMQNRTQMPCVQQSVQIIRPTPTRIIFPRQIAQHRNFIAGITS
ncbi:hypothetical protein ACHQM5_010278 [Ranunculus cassubicifolius]